MNKLQIANEAHFKNAAKKAILSIVFFALSYFTLLILSIAFAIACGFAGVAIMSIKVNALTIGFGLGVMILGVIVFIFLIKFLFKKHVVDRSHLVELEESDAPLLYEEIRLIVAQVQTSFPKKIYLSNDVNAAVFYDSTFLSLFFPIKKNLQIGLGLVNSVSKDELRVILAHEFGHFSQRSMKVGSYVYTVNQIIFNMLYDNEGYNRGLDGLSQFSYFSIFTAIGIKIVAGIQWLLIKLYGVVNVNHMGLSREMEFHADAIAANTVGSGVFASSLLRVDLASQSYNQVLSYYEKKITDKIKPENIYPQQHFVMNLMAKEADVEIVGHFPQVSLTALNRYNKSKLTIKDQWASHPSTLDRISAVEQYHFEKGVDSGIPATQFFADIEKLQRMVTEVLFANVNYNGEVTKDTFESFKNSFLSDRKIADFPKLFNGYYDNHNPVKIDLENSTVNTTSSDFASLFAPDRVDMIYALSAMKSDVAVLQQIKSGELSIKSFDYDGKKCNAQHVDELLAQLETEISQLKAKIAVNDQEIYQYLKQIAETNGRGTDLLEKYKAYIDFDKIYDKAIEIYSKAINETNFVQFTTPFEEIMAKFQDFRKTEKLLKDFISELLANTNLTINEDTRSIFETYLKEELNYFIHSVYKDENLDILFRSLGKIVDVVNENYLLVKESFLHEMESLVRQSDKALVADN